MKKWQKYSLHYIPPAELHYVPIVQHDVGWSAGVQMYIYHLISVRETSSHMTFCGHPADAQLVGRTTRQWISGQKVFIVYSIYIPHIFFNNKVLQ